MININNKLKKIINQIVKKKIKIDNNTILTSSILDSLNMLILIDRIESEFKIKLNESDLHFTNFENIKKISKVIENKNVK